VTAPRRPHLRIPDPLPSAAVAGAVAGLAACLASAPAHPALVVTSDAATAVVLAAALLRRLADPVVRLAAAVDVAALAMSYARQLGPVTSACLLLATLLLAASPGPHADG
jgi:hypothetical protein